MSPCRLAVKSAEADHVVALVALQHVGLEQRVVREAARGDAVAGEHLPVVLRVLADLGLRGVLEPRLEPREHEVLTFYPGTDAEGDAQPVTVGSGDEVVAAFTVVSKTLDPANSR